MAKNGPKTKQLSAIQTGNIGVDSAPARGWLVGHFIDEAAGGLRHSDNVEIKWGTHRAGEGRDEWVAGEARTTICILVSGVIELEFGDRTIRLAQAGDYVMWGNGTTHRWRAIADTVAITVRWPSIVV